VQLLKTSSGQIDAITGETWQEVVSHIQTAHQTSQSVLPVSHTLPVLNQNNINL